jgi:hypothetical protein
MPFLHPAWKYRTEHFLKGASSEAGEGKEKKPNEGTVSWYRPHTSYAQNALLLLRVRNAEKSVLDLTYGRT